MTDETPSSKAVTQPLRVEREIEEFAKKIAAVGGTSLELPLCHAIALTGPWRVYYNRRGAAPMVWCIAPEHGGWEIAVARVAWLCDTTTVYRPKAIADEDDGKPSAWLAMTGTLTVSADGHARIDAC